MADNAEKNIHAGHRKRMKEQYLKQGFSSFHPHEVLELLLFFALPREDTNPLAHRLLQRFGSLEGVLNAPAEELMREKGVGTNTVILLRLIQELGKNAAAAAPVKPVSLASSARACQYVLQLLRDKPVEACYLLCLDCKHRLIRSICLNEGGPPM